MIRPMMMERMDWRTAPALLALMSLPRVGPATALAVGRGERDVDELSQPEALAALYDGALKQIDRLQQGGVIVLGFFDDRFPARLREAPLRPRSSTSVGALMRSCDLRWR